MAGNLNLDLLEELHGLPSGLLPAVMKQESGGDPNAVSPKGARGVFQFMPATARQYGIDPTDPKQAAGAAAKMFSELNQKYGGDVQKMLAAYNWGQGRVDRLGLDRAPAETRDYIRKVTTNMGQPQTASPAGRDLSSELFGGGGSATPAKQAAPAGRDLSADLFGEEATPVQTKTGQAPAASVKLTKNMSDDDIIRSFGYDPAVVKKSGQYKPGMFKDAITDPNSFTAKVMDSPLGGIIRGVRDPVDAGAQLVTRGLEKLGLQSKSDVALVELINKVAEADYQQNWRHGENINPDTGEGKFEWPRLAGNIAVPVKGAGLVKGTGAVANTARAAVAGGIAGATATGVTDTSPDVGGATDDFWSQKGKQTATGVVLGPVAQALMQKAVVPVIGKTVNAVKNAVDPAAKTVQDLGEKFGVRTTYGDITQKAGAQKAEVAMEQVPVVGTAGFRAAQQTEASGAANKVVDGLREKMINSGFKGMAQIDAAASKGNKVAIALQNEIANSGDDWNKIVQTSGNVQAFRSKLIADKLYGKVETLANQAGDVPLNNTFQAAQAARKAVEASPLPDQSVLNLLNKIEEGITKPGVDASFTGARRLRSDLGDLINDYYKGANAVTGSKGAGVLQQVKSAVEQDMQDFAVNSGNRDLATAWKRADRFYRESVVPYKDRMLASALKDAPADEVYGKFVQAGKGDRAQKFYEALDPKGQSAVRYGMVANALDKATNESTEVFSPAKFAQSLERVKEAQGVFFKGQDKWELDGFTKLMRHVERAGQYAENPPTGQRVVPWLVGGAAAMNPEAVATGLGLSTVARLMFTTAAGKRFLLAASDLQPSSPAMAKLLDKINQEMPRVAGAAGSRAVQGSGTTTEQEND